MALQQLSIRGGNQAIPVNGDLGGSLFTNNGPDTVYYGPTSSITSTDGTSIASGASATLIGTQYLVVANTLGALAKVAITPTYAGTEHDREVLTQLQVTGNTAIGGTLAATGASTLAGAVSATKASGTGLAVTANATVGGTLAVTGASTLTGAVTAAKPTGTGLAVTADATIGGTTTVTGQTTTGGLALTDATDVTIATGTGSKIGQASSKVGFFGVTPVARAAAYTQTYSTAARTVPNATAVAVDTTAATQTTPYGYAQAQADAIPVAINALEADVVALKQVVNALIDDSQAIGIAQ